jgi:hypothetical protein
MTTLEVVAALGERADGIPGMAHRVRATLNYLARARKAVAKDGKRQDVKWSLCGECAAPGESYSDVIFRVARG